MRERRDRKILNKRKNKPLFVDVNVCTRALAIILPEIARISTLMSSDRELSFDKILSFRGGLPNSL